MPRVTPLKGIFDFDPQLLDDFCGIFSKLPKKGWFFPSQLNSVFSWISNFQIFKFSLLSDPDLVHGFTRCHPESLIFSHSDEKTWLETSVPRPKSRPFFSEVSIYNINFSICISKLLFLYSNHSWSNSVGFGSSKESKALDFFNFRFFLAFCGDLFPAPSSSVSFSSTSDCLTKLALLLDFLRCFLLDFLLFFNNLGRNWLI